MFSAAVAGVGCSWFMSARISITLCCRSGVMKIKKPARLVVVKNCSRRARRAVIPDVYPDYFQNCNFITVGVPITKLHSHPQGLAQLIYSNCVVMVRLGHDLDHLTAWSGAGPVQLCNVQTNGLSTTLLPVFLFLRWLSSARRIMSHSSAVK